MSSITDLHKLTEILLAENRELKSRISSLEEENRTLRERLSRYEHPRDSHNSHLPPSKDPIGRVNRSLRQSGGKKSGGQKGHPGKTLEFQHPDKIEELSNAYCSYCGKDLSSVQGSISERRQQIDLPVIQPIVREYRKLSKCCPGCGIQSAGEFPDGLTPGISYAPSVYSLVSYLNVVHIFLSLS